MSYTLNDKIIGLAGIFQSASLVQKIANTGTCDHFYYERTLKSLFATSPENTIAVYQDEHGIQLGIRTLIDILKKDSGQQNVEIIRYALSLIHLERKLSSQPDMLSVISNRLQSVQSQMQHFGSEHDNVVHNLAGLYSDTISTFKLRIQVSGNPNYLRNELIAAKVRTLLLCGIRAAILWHQVGGRRWQLVLQRNKLLRAAENMLI